MKKYLEVNKVYNKKTKKYYIRNMFKAFVVDGNVIEVSKMVTYKFGPASPELDSVK